MHCLTCHYDLTNLDGRRCPECGRTFNPSDASTFVSEQWYQLRTAALRRFILWCSLFPAIAFAVIGLMGLLFQDMYERERSTLLDVVTIGTSVLILLIPLSVVATIFLIVAALLTIWQGGWPMRNRILFGQFGLVLGIWIATALFGWWVISTIAV